MKTILTLFVLLFSSSVVANSGTIYPYIFDVKDSSQYPYKGKKALEKKRSEVAGRDSKWLTWCEGKTKENAIWTKEQVKKLSKPDYKLFMKEYRKQPKGAWCGSDDQFMKRNSKYIRDLQAKVDLEFGLIKRPPYYCQNRSTQVPYKEGKLSANPCGEHKQITKDEYAKLLEDFEKLKPNNPPKKREVN